GYSPSRPDCTESAIQRRIISRSIVCASMRKLRPELERASLAERAASRPARKRAARRLALHHHGALCPPASGEGECRGGLSGRKRISERRAHLLGRHIHQAHRDLYLLLHVAGEVAGGGNRLLKGRRVVAHPAWSVFGFPGRAHGLPSLVCPPRSYYGRTIATQQGNCALHKLCHRQLGVIAFSGATQPPPAMSRGEKLRSSTFHSRYLSAGRNA